MTMFNKVVKSFKYGDHNVRLETGEIARQASGAVICDMDDTVVLATVVAKKEIKPGQDFFPLTVDYIEKTYAAGRIPGGFDQSLVSCEVATLEVVKELTTAGNHLQKTATAVVVFRVTLKCSVSSLIRAVRRAT